MAQHLNIFETEAAYNSAASALNLPGVSLALNNGSIKYDPIFNFNPKYLYADLSTSKTLDNSKRVIGIEVVPAKHTPNGKTRYMSIKNMSHINPEVGTSAVGNVAYENGEGNDGTIIPWGIYNDPISELTAYGNYPKPMKYTGDPEEGDVEYLAEIDTESESDGNVIPGDTDEVDSPVSYSFEPEGFTWYGDNGADRMLPFPFNRNGKRNLLFVQDNTWIIDMSGKSNTQVLVNRITGDAWKTGALDLDVDNLEALVIKHPAAASCYRFNAGISNLSGKWYLPAAGELCYLWANINKINTKLAAIKAADGAVCVGMGTSTDYPCWGEDSPDTTGLGGWLWSSSVFSSGSAWGLNAYFGTVNDGHRSTRDYYNRVRAFFEL